jgi:hypothetical protein
MRFLILFILTSRVLILHAQINRLDHADLIQSTYFGSGRLDPYREKPAPPDRFDFIRTENESNAFWQADLKTPVRLKSLRFDCPDDSKPCYILMSAYPMLYDDLRQLLASQVVEHIYLPSPGLTHSFIPLGNRTARYIRVQQAEPGELNCRNAVLLGGSNQPEIAGNGIDDDGDGRTDCDDPDLTPAFLGLTVASPACRDCNDGALYVQAGGRELSVSLDGGLTFQNMEGEDGYYRIPISSGLYHLVLTDATGCSAVYPENPVLVRKISEEDPSCANANFQNGWTGWSGALGTHLSTGPYFPHNGFDPAGIRHAILHSNPATTDPTVGALIPLSSPTGGNAFARLGSYSVANSQSQKLQYCFTVTPENQNLSFWYAAVLYDGGHPIPDQAFFQWTIFDPNNQVIASNTLVPGAGMIAYDSVVYYKPWDCVSADLSPYIGMQVCVQFISSGCSFAGHGGYAYVDGLCRSPEAASLSLPAEVCADPGKITASVSGGSGFSGYYWQVEQVDGDGHPIPGTIATGPLLHLVPIAPLDDVLGFWKSYFPSSRIPCGSRFQVSINLRSLCGANSTPTSKTFVTTCPPSPIQYCDLFVCNGYTGPIQTQGSGSCNTCQYSWSPAAGLNNPHAAFPEITGFTGPGTNYNVTITDGNGCNIPNQVQVVRGPQLTGILEGGFLCNDACTAKLTATFSTLVPINPDALKLIAWTGVSGQNVGFTFTYLQTLPGGLKRYHFTSDPFANAGSGPNGANPADYTLLLQPVAPPGFCQVGDCSTAGVTTHVQVPRGLFYGKPDVYVPNVFQPSNPNPANQVFNPFFSTTYPHSGVFWMSIAVYDRYGGLVYKNENKMDPNCSTTAGLKGNETGFPWNGHWNNDPNAQLAGQGVYAWVIHYRNCQAEWQINGDVTLLW